MKYVLKRRSGFSLVEVLMGSALLSILSLSALQALKFMNVSQQTAEMSIAMTNMAQDMIGSGTGALAYQQRDLFSVMGQSVDTGQTQRIVDIKMGDPTDLSDSLAKLPVAFDDKDFDEGGKCDQSACKGRMGVYYQRSPMVGLSLGTMRMAHPEMGVKEVIFLATY